MIAFDVHFTNDAVVHRGTRMLKALCKVLIDLTKPLTASELASRPPAFAPFPKKVMGMPFPGTTPPLYPCISYTEHVLRKRVYRAVMQTNVDSDNTSQGRRVVVKLSKTYGDAAHRYASLVMKPTFAPQLIDIQHVYDWYVVVMEDLTYDGFVTLAEAMQINELQASIKSLKAGLKDVLSKRVRELNSLYVHGDIRALNIMVNRQDLLEKAETASLAVAAATMEKGSRAVQDTDREKIFVQALDGLKIMLVDWEWSGVASQVKYPFPINTSIVRAGGVKTGRPIVPQHDIYSIARLFE